MKAVIRVLSPLVAVATLVTLFLGFPSLIQSTISTDALRSTVSVPASQLTLVCPGPVVRIGGTDGTDPEIQERIGVADRIYFSQDDLTIDSAGTSVNRAEGLGIDETSGSEILRLNLLAQQQGNTALTSSQTQNVSAARLQGLAASGCVQPAAEQWFVAGSANRGSESLMIIVNPAPVASSVTVTVHLATGATRADQVVVAAGETTVLSLDSLANSETEFTVHLRASQGKVAGFLQQRQTSGLSALGVAVTTPAQAASVTQVVPGILVRGAEFRADAGQAGNYVRIFNPGSSSSEVLIEVVGSSTSEFGGVIMATISAGTTVDVPLSGLPNGNYSAFISASVPVIAGAISIGAVSLEAQDIVWSQSAELLMESIGLAMLGDAGLLQLTNPNSDELAVSISDGSGVTGVILPPRSTRVFPATQGSLRIESADSDLGLVANLIFESQFGFGVAAVGSNSNLGSEIQVRVWR